MHRYQHLLDIVSTMLKDIYLFDTAISGNITNLKALPNLKEVNIWDTYVTGNKELFHKYRQDSGLEECEVIF